MNSEVLETSKNECNVICDDTKVRKLTKIDSTSDFKTILETENKVEILEKEKKKLEQRIDNNNLNNITFWVIAICVVVLGRIATLIIGYLGHDILLNQTLGSVRNSYIGCSLFSLVMATTYTIRNFITKRKLRKRISNLDHTLKKLSNDLETMKTNDKVEEIELSNTTINIDTVDLLNDAYKVDYNARKIPEENNDTNVEDKGYTYSLRR